jgi:DNA helicase-4
VTLNALSPASIRLEVDDAVKLPCLDVVAISVSKALLWHTVEVRSRDRIDNLSCLSVYPKTS